ncbi:hypothetical protein PVL29_022852 [Vitis rotundifolia]|uniref:Uncharacterized protein n=1 Tax=Vitis rotundifolia TaxID=103349 RepID=A0AA38YX69_VITRO|nr:hypothetical protein PVL29_022852 [Vitis rotundifolia]
MGIAEKKMQNRDFVGAHMCWPANYIIFHLSNCSSSVQFTPSPSATSVNMCSEQTNAATSGLVEYPAKQETKTNEEMKVSISSNVPNAKVLEDQACISSNTASEQVQEDQAAL